MNKQPRLLLLYKQMEVVYIIACIYVAVQRSREEIYVAW
jgi:hypothetical protein